MENKDTNMDYQQIVMVGNEKWGIVEITIGIIFFCLRSWDSYSLFFIYGVFKSHLKKITESANSHPKFRFDLSPSYINVLKNGSAPPMGGTNYALVYLKRNSDIFINFQYQKFIDTVTYNTVFPSAVINFNITLLNKTSHCTPTQGRWLLI